MMRFAKIMVPVYFSDAAKTAVQYGLSLALQFDARLILAHIVPYDTSEYDKAMEDLLGLIPKEYRDRLNFEIIVRSGEVRSELLQIVQEREIDLIVMGTPSKPYFERLVLKSVTERIMRNLNIPIITVSDAEAVPPRRILYATDLGGGSEEGLAFCVRLARAFDASLTVAHVAQPGDNVLHAVGSGTRSEEKLRRMVGVVPHGSVPISTVLADGDPSETINALASQNTSDMIVINLNNKGRFGRWILGTTAERVIRTAKVPVLSLPLPATYSSRWAAA